MSGGGGDQVTGYRYSLGVHMGVAHGPIDALLAIKVGDREAWTGNLTSSGTITISKPDLFGGDEKEGGIDGVADVMMGGDTQTANAYLTAQQGLPQPGYRGILSLVYRGLVSANNPYLKPWAMRVRRIAQGWKGGSPWYPEKAAIVLPNGAGQAMNPAHIVYQCVTDDAWGMGLGSSVINDASFRAAADVFHAEGLGLCLHWTRQSTVEEFIRVVMDHAGAVLAQNRRTGLFELIPIRGGYSLASLPVFDQTNVIELESYQRPSPVEAVNEITVSFVEVTTGEKGSVTAQNLANVQSQGGTVAQPKSYPGIPTADLAVRVALRDLVAISTPLARVRLKVNRAGYALVPGNVVRFSWPKLGLVDLVLRVLQVRHDDTGGGISLECAEDVFAMPASGYVKAPPIAWSDPSNVPGVATNRIVTEATFYELQQRLGQAAALALAADAGYITTAAARPTSDAMSYQVRTRVGSAAYQRQAVGHFVPSGQISSELSITATTCTIGQTVDRELIEPGIVAAIGDELVRVDGFNAETGALTIGRGILDTTPKIHASGTRVYFLIGALMGFENVERVDGEVVSVKLLPRTGRGTLPEASAPVDVVTLDQRATRPYPPGRLRIAGQAYPSALIDQRVVISWSHRSRVQQNLEGEETGNIGPEAGTTYSARLLRASDSSVVASISGISGTSWDAGVPAADTYIAEVWSVRGGLESRQRARAGFVVSYATDPAWSRRWGVNWGRPVARPQIAQVTLGGLFDPDTIFRVTLGGTPFDYTAVAGDVDLAGVASDLAAVIDASPSYAATAAGQVVTITGPMREAFTIETSTPAAGVSIGFSTKQTAEVARAGNRQVVFFRAIGQSPGFVLGYEYWQQVAGLYTFTLTHYADPANPPDFTFVAGWRVNAGYQGAAGVVANSIAYVDVPGVDVGSSLGDLKPINANAYTSPANGDGILVTDPSGYNPATWCAPPTACPFTYDFMVVFPRGERALPDEARYSEHPTLGTIIVTGADTHYFRFAPPSYAATNVMQAYVAPGFLERIPADRPQITEINVNGTPQEGYVYTVNLEASTFSYTAIAGDDEGDVITALAALIDASPSFSAVAIAPSASVPFWVARVTGATAAVPFTASGSVKQTDSTISHTITQTAI